MSSGNRGLRRSRQGVLERSINQLVQSLLPFTPTLNPGGGGRRRDPQLPIHSRLRGIVLTNLFPYIEKITCASRPLQQVQTTSGSGVGGFQSNYVLLQIQLQCPTAGLYCSLRYLLD